MKVFIHELMTAGGVLGAKTAPGASLLREGAAMLAAVAADFAAVDGVDVELLCAEGLAPRDIAGCSVHTVATGSAARQEQDAFDRLACQADWTLVIAPELDGLLLDRVCRVEDVGGHLLGPAPDLIRLTSNKEWTARALAASGVAVPAGRMLLPGEELPGEFPYPAVLKPVVGAGSLDVQLVRGPGAGTSRRTSTRRLERFYPGLPASVAVLCGPAGCHPLVACRQELSGDGRFTYLGGELPLSEPLGARAVRLARQAIGALDGPLGYLGVDMVLDTTSDGADDVVIEINPRLTTSYVGLRAATDDNLAAAMLAIARGGCMVPTFHAGTVRFTAEGDVDYPSGPWRRDRRTRN